MGQGQAYSALEVVRKAIEQQTKSQAKVEYSFGQVADASEGSVASAYINGSDTVSEDFRIPGHLWVNAGDYAVFAVDHARGTRYIVEVLPNSLFSKIALDVNNGIIYVGDGTEAGVPFYPINRDEEIWEGDDFSDVEMVYEGDTLSTITGLWER